MFCVLRGKSYFCRKIWECGCPRPSSLANSDNYRLKKHNAMAKKISKNSQYVRFDWAIKRILRDKANKKVLEGLISVLFKKPVTIMEILESENNKARKEDKTNCVDVKAKMEDGEIVIVEVQLSREADFFNRILFGTATAINDQIETTQGYSTIKKVYSINILYFNFGEGDDYAYHGYMDFHGMTKEGSTLRFNNENEKKYIRSNAKHITPPEEVFPEIYLLIVDKFNEVAKTPIEEWMAYLKDGIISDDTKDPGLQEARRKLDFMKMTREEQRAYRDFMVSVYSTKDAFDTARSEGYEEGFGEGIEKGMAEGIEKGMAEGRAEGMAEGIEKGGKDEKIRISRSLKGKIPVELIMASTGLSAEEIAAL